MGCTIGEFFTAEVNSTEELSEIKALYEALCQRFYGSRLKLIVLIDMQERMKVMCKLCKVKVSWHFSDMLLILDA